MSGSLIVTVLFDFSSDSLIVTVLFVFSSDSSPGGSPQHHYDGPNVELEQSLPGVIMSLQQNYCHFLLQVKTRKHSKVFGMSKQSFPVMNYRIMLNGLSVKNVKSTAGIQNPFCE